MTFLFERPPHSGGLALREITSFNQKPNMYRVFHLVSLSAPALKVLHQWYLSSTGDYIGSREVVKPK